jgi:hypothetical protein
VADVGLSRAVDRYLPQLKHDSSSRSWC